jgi:hypothetical protein
MSIFTRILTLLAITGVVATGQAQTYDLAVSAVGTAANASNQIPAGMLAPITMTLKNNGSNAIPAGTEFLLGITVNGSAFVGPDTFVFSAAFAAGGEIPLVTNASYSFEGSTPNYEICGSAYFTTPSLESNPNNNLNCETFIASSAAHNDWASLSISIESPSNLDGFDLDNNTNTVPDVDSVVVVLQNNSNITFPLNYPVNYALALNGDTTNVTGFLASELAPGGQTTRYISNASILPATPQDSGTYDMCVIVREEGDNQDSNDVSCTTFTIIDSYDPFHPSNWPLGEDEVSAKSLELVPMNDQVRVQGVSNSTAVTITDMQGRVVRQLNLNEDVVIPMADQASGVYIIQASDEANGQVEVQKFNKQ